MAKIVLTDLNHGGSRTPNGEGLVQPATLVGGLVDPEAFSIAASDSLPGQPLNALAEPQPRLVAIRASHVHVLDFVRSFHDESETGGGIFAHQVAHDPIRFQMIVDLNFE